jgi:hypothetical protein
MPCCRFKRRVSYANAFGPIYGGPRWGQGMIEVGEVIYDEPVIGLGVFLEDIEVIPLPGDDGLPTTIDEVGAACQKLLTWILTKYLPHPKRNIGDRLRELLDVSARLADAPPTPFDSDEIRRAGSMPDLIRLTGFSQVMTWSLRPRRRPRRKSVCRLWCLRNATSTPRSSNKATIQ